MRTRHTPAAFVFAACLVPAAALSVGEEAALRDGWIGAEFVDPANPDAVEITRTGEAAINWLGAKLVREVNTALAKGSPESAVAICHLKNLGATETHVLPGMPAIKGIKRTSLRVLNPANAPDVAERLVLERVQRELGSDRPPATTIVQRVTLNDRAVEWRVYRPLVILPACLACHGDPAAQSPELQRLLQRDLPDNPASGYRLGEWRGLLRVTVAPASRAGQ